MIELVSSTRCIECNICVKVCPTNVFDAVEGGVPVIARKDDCQTCFMCETNCPVDALYVAPECDVHVAVDEAELVAAGLLGGFRENWGIGPGRVPNSARLKGDLRRFFQEPQGQPRQAAGPS
jgi:NAD-dependent dihydropyrimidine dehydrogenase PreA subunit